MIIFNTIQYVRHKHNFDLRFIYVTIHGGKKDIMNDRSLFTIRKAQSSISVTYLHRLIHS